MSTYYVRSTAATTCPYAKAPTLAADCSPARDTVCLPGCHDERLKQRCRAGPFLSLSLLPCWTDVKLFFPLRRQTLIIAPTKKNHHPVFLLLTHRRERGVNDPRCCEAVRLLLNFPRNLNEATNSNQMNKGRSRQPKRRDH
jgi:hypothetical protein